MDAQELLARCLVVDGHTDTPTRLFHRPADLAERLPDGHVDLPRLRRGGVSALVFALYVPAQLDPEAGWEHALALYDRVERQWSPGELELVVSAEEVRRGAAESAVGVLLGLENGRPLTRPEALYRCASLGVRYVTLCHNASHEWCDAATDEARHGGLSDGGVKIVREMRMRGILADVSHASDDAVLHVLDALRGPVIASHSSSRALCDHPRNLPDSLVLEITRRGGVVMLNSAPFLLDGTAARVQQRRADELARRSAELDPGQLHEGMDLYREIAESHPLPPVPLDRYVDHVVHVVELAGEEHVGIGTDFDGITETLDGFEDVSRFPALTQRLLDRGLPAKAVQMILGENFLRVLEEAERRAR